MNLTTQEKNRYSRHILLNEIGEKGQEKLKQAKVLVIGAGGLGCPVLQYLVAAGVGNIGIIDFDLVEESNLQRQILFGSNDIGKPKSLVAKQKLQAQNPHVKIDSFEEKLTKKNVFNYLKNYDIIVDASDNYETRYLVNDTCFAEKKPLIYGAIHKFEGQISVFHYQNGPTYRCLFSEPPTQELSCSEIGVLGILPGIIGSFQANEVLKIILEIGSVLSGKLLIYNSLENSFLTLKINKTKAQPKTKKEIQNFDYNFTCENKILNEISKKEFDNLPENKFVLDVRKENQNPKIAFENYINIPFEKLKTQEKEISKNEPVYVICQKGKTSILAINLLEKEFGFGNLINVIGGLERR